MKRWDAAMVLAGLLIFCWSGVAFKWSWTKKQADAPPKAKDNALCLGCHLDFETELLVVKHLTKKITCTSCHGSSRHHFSDESGNTKPDILFGRAEVEPFCRKCHKKHRNPQAVEAFRKQWRGKLMENGRVVQDDSICTDCHGQHLILRRSK